MRPRSLVLPLAALIPTMVLCAASPGAELSVERTDEGAVVRIDGELFAQYVSRSDTKPIIWPIIGPTGQPMTREWPMGEGEGERQDHPHQRSLWFAHGDVDGVDFWHRPGVIEERALDVLATGSEAVVRTRNDWMGPDGKLCEDEQVWTFGVDGENRYIDLDITITASEGAVTFGDTKEGTAAIRVAETMKVDAQLGGRIVSSEGLTDGEAWGKPAPWVDYHGPVAGETVGVAIFNHPSSFRFPTFWHVRTYGLFAANPFGVRDFTGDSGRDGSHTIPAGESITLHYRFFFHKGDTEAAGVADAYAAYAAEDR